MTHTSLRFAALNLAILVGAATSATAADFAIKETANQHIDVTYEGKSVLRLMTANDTSTEESALETYKIYAHVMDPTDADNQRTLTKGAGDKFTHHRGIFIGFARAEVEGVGGVDTWHMKSGVRQHYKKIVKQDTNDDSATLAVAIDWVKNDKPLMSELRTFIVHKPAANGAIVIDTSSEITATVGKTLLKGDPEHAGLQYRAHEEVVGNKSAKYLFPEGKTPGNKGDKDIPWAAMTFKAHGNDYHVQHMSHPTLPKGNIYSAYRDYGRFGAYFVKELAKGETATFKVRFFVSPGEFPADAEKVMNAHYDDYVSQVK